MRSALVILTLTLLATSGQATGIDIIQESSGLPYFAYDMEVDENGHVTIWTDETTLGFLDEQENTTFLGVK